MTINPFDHTISNLSRKAGICEKIYNFRANAEKMGAMIYIIFYNSINYAAIINFFSKKYTYPACKNISFM